MFSNVVKQLDKQYTVICRQSQKILSERNLKTIPRYAGVYVLYYKEKPFYVGRSNNIYKRFMHQHLSKRNDVASSSFRMHIKILKKITRYKEARNWIVKNCKVKFVKIDNYDDSILLEALLIRLWRKKYRLVNDNKYEL